MRAPDAAYSESQFKTMKYRLDFPARVGCIEDARTHCQAFFASHTHAVQRPSPDTISAAHISLDQPTTIGDRRPKNTTALHSKFMTPGDAKSLTRSGLQRACLGGEAHPQGLLVGHVGGYGLHELHSSAPKLKSATSRRPMRSTLA